MSGRTLPLLLLLLSVQAAPLHAAPAAPPSTAHGHHGESDDGFGLVRASALSATTFAVALNGINASAFNASAATRVIGEEIARSAQRADGAPRGWSNARRTTASVAFLQYAIAFDADVTAAGAAEQEATDDGHEAFAVLILNWSVSAPPLSARFQRASGGGDTAVLGVITGFEDAADGPRVRVAPAADADSGADRSDDSDQSAALAASTLAALAPRSSWNVTASGGRAATLTRTAAPAVLSAVFLVQGHPQAVSAALLALAAATQPGAAARFLDALATSGAAAPGVTLAQKPGAPVPVLISVRGAPSQAAAQAGVARALGSAVLPGSVSVSVESYDMECEIALPNAAQLSNDTIADDAARAVATELQLADTEDVSASVTAAGVAVAVTFPAIAGNEEAAAAAAADAAAAASSGYLADAVAAALGGDAGRNASLVGEPTTRAVLSVSVTADDATQRDALTRLNAADGSALQDAPAEGSGASVVTVCVTVSALLAASLLLL
jgi:hypothetical protein